MAIAVGGGSGGDSAIGVNTSAQSLNNYFDREPIPIPPPPQEMTLFERTIHLKEHIIRNTIKIRDGLRFPHIES